MRQTSVVSQIPQFIRGESESECGHLIHVWLACRLLHASREFLFPFLRRDPRPFKFQFLLNVNLLALFKKRRILVAGGRQKVWCHYLIAVEWFYLTFNKEQFRLPANRKASLKTVIQAESAARRVKHSLLAQTFLQGCVLRSTLEHHEETRLLTAVGEGWVEKEEVQKQS